MPIMKLEWEGFEDGEGRFWRCGREVLGMGKGGFGNEEGRFWGGGKEVLGIGKGG